MEEVVGGWSEALPYTPIPRASQILLPPAIAQARQARLGLQNSQRVVSKIYIACHAADRDKPKKILEEE